jgi:hypothetical protein
VSADLIPHADVGNGSGTSPALKFTGLVDMEEEDDPLDEDDDNQGLEENLETGVVFY